MARAWRLSDGDAPTQDNTLLSCVVVTGWLDAVLWNFSSLYLYVLLFEEK